MENHQPEHEQIYAHNEQHEDFKSRIPPGYRFVPDDVQLIDDYLKVIVEHPELGGVHGVIFTVNLYGCGPDELTAAHREQCEGQWYFFTKRTRKYTNGSRPDRTAGQGYWKQTNVGQDIFRAGENNKPIKIGKKITLDYLFKRNSADKIGSRTDWKMNEYRLDGVNLPKVQFCEWCLCRLYISKNAKTTKNDNTQVNLQVEAEPSSGTQLIAAQEHNEHVVGELQNNFSGQCAAGSFNDQQMIAQEQYNGQNAGGPGPNFVQQTTNLQFNNVDFGNPNNSNYMETATSGSMSTGMQYTTNDLLIDHQNNYPSTGTMLEDAGYVQPIRSLPPGEFPTWSDYNLNQSSSSIPDLVTSDLEFEIPCDVDFTFDDFDI